MPSCSLRSFNRLPRCQTLAWLARSPRVGRFCRAPPLESQDASVDQTEARCAEVIGRRFAPCDRRILRRKGAMIACTIAPAECANRRAKHRVFSLTNVFHVYRSEPCFIWYPRRPRTFTDCARSSAVGACQTEVACGTDGTDGPLRNVGIEPSRAGEFALLDRASRGRWRWGGRLFSAPETVPTVPNVPPG
jgi:hypothetical protein